MSATVKMNLTISGTVNGKPWPEAGGLVTVDDDEAARLVAIGHAELVEGEQEGEVVDLSSPVYPAEVEADGTVKAEPKRSAKTSS